MKAIFIGEKRVKEVDLFDQTFDDEFLNLLHDYKILESHVIYFSAGDSKIKEILVKKEPSYSI